MSATTQSSDDDVNEEVLLGGFEDDGDALETEVSCPMCRTLTKAALHAETREMLVERYPVLYEERRVREEAERGVSEGVEKMTVLVGNKHALVAAEGNKHDWTFFVKFSKPEMVRSVEVRLVSLM